MVAQITNIDTKYFSFNGNTTDKVFIVEVLSDTHVQLANVYDTRKKILEPTNISEIEVEGVVHTSMPAFTNALKGVTYLNQIDFQTSVDTSGFEKIVNKNTPGGYAGLNAGSKIDNIYLSLGLNDVENLNAVLNNKVDLDGTAYNSSRLNGQLASYYATQSVTYTKTEVDNEIAEKINAATALLQNNTDAPLNSIQELLTLVNNADANLINSIAEKVSYVSSQMLTTAQKVIAQTNIGLQNAAITSIDNPWSSHQTFTSATFGGNVSVVDGHISIDDYGSNSNAINIGTHKDWTMYHDGSDNYSQVLNGNMYYYIGNNFDHIFIQNSIERLRLESAGTSVSGVFKVSTSVNDYYGVRITGGQDNDPQILIGDWHNSSAVIKWDSTTNKLIIDSQHSTANAAIDFTGNDQAVTYGGFSSTGKFSLNYGLKVLVSDSERDIYFNAPNNENRFKFYVGGTGNDSFMQMYGSDGTTVGVQFHSNASSYSYVNSGFLVGTVSSNGGYKFRVLGSTELDGNVDIENALSVDSTITVFDQIIGGIGAKTTGGTLDWNHSTNARSGNGYSLLAGSATNGHGEAGLHHAFSFEYSSKTGTGNMTQFSIPYGGTELATKKNIYYRTRYSGSWAGWQKIITENNIVDQISGAFVTINTPQNITGVKTFTANTSFNSNLNLGDSGVLRLGAGGDLNFYHNGTYTNMDIYNSSLYIRALSSGNDIIFQTETDGGSLQSVVGIYGGSSTFFRAYHNNSNRLETSASGIKVVASTSGNAQVHIVSNNQGTSQDNWYLRAQHSDKDFVIVSNSTEVFRLTDSSGNLSVKGNATAVNFIGALNGKTSDTAATNNTIAVRNSSAELNASNFVGNWNGRAASTSANPNTIVLRDSAGYIRAQYYHSEGLKSNVASSSIGGFAIRNTANDGFIYGSSLASVSSAISTQLDLPNNYIRTANAINQSDASVTFTTIRSISQGINVSGNTGYPTTAGQSILFSSGFGGGSSYARDFMLHKAYGTEDLYLQTYNSSTGNANGWRKFLHEGNFASIIGSNYATQTWVNSQGFLSSATGLATETYVNSQKFIKALNNPNYFDVQEIKKVSQSEYDALSASEKNDEKIMYLIGTFTPITA